MKEIENLEEYEDLDTGFGPLPSDRMKKDMRPSDKQVGGDHYKGFAIQPSKFCELNNLNHLESQVIKYLTRASIGGGEKQDPVGDLRKAKHCIDLILEWRYENVEDTDSG